MKRDDTLWKSILEDLIVQFLHFFFKEADKLLDFNKKTEFLDKEMAQISQAEELESPKFVVLVGTGRGLYLQEQQIQNVSPHAILR